MTESTHSRVDDVGGVEGVEASSHETPHVEALFLIRFDKKVGYTIAWKRTAGETELDGVEFKALPSGLHALTEDLVYFTHAGHAGLAAFARGEGSEADRHANFVSVGVLVRREGRVGGAGRLGRAWLLAGRLAATAGKLAAAAVTAGDDEMGEGATEALLDGVWDDITTNAADTATTPPTKTAGQQHLPPHHPARAVVQYLALFGPLVFRLQQAALLRKRILFVGSAPVRTTCEFVYNLSVLSTISSRDADLLDSSTDDLLRLPALFSVGVHDIPELDALRATPAGWVACTTDDIIATKNALFDIVVEMPPTSDATPSQRRWPRLRTSGGDVIKASQRDVARYKLLHRELWKHRRDTDEFHDDDDDDDNNNHDDDTAPLISHDTSHTSHDVNAERADDDFNDAYDEKAVESMTWSRLAYQGFMWWASAGERNAYTTAEDELDRELIGDMSAYEDSIETAIIAYFHRHTSLLVKALSQLVDDEHDEEEESEDDEVLWIDRGDLRRMGLDTWSEADRAYVQEFGSLYFGRRVEVRGNEVDCCGLRVPAL